MPSPQGPFSWTVPDDPDKVAAGAGAIRDLAADITATVQQVQAVAQVGQTVATQTGRLHAKTITTPVTTAADGTFQVGGFPADVNAGIASMALGTTPTAGGIHPISFYYVSSAGGTITFRAVKRDGSPYAGNLAQVMALGWAGQYP